MSESKLLASLAVFRQCYDDEKDVIDIISKFLLNVIIVESKRSFNITEITGIFNEYYAFEIPEAVIQTTLKRLKKQEMITYEEGRYSYSKKADVYLGDDFQNVEKENNELISALFSYIEQKESTKLTEEQKEVIRQSLIDFTLEKTCSKYKQLISAFLIENASEFRNTLTQIKQGAVLYQGVTYTTNLNETNWKNSLIIFLDTEMLFYLAGYSGETYQKISNEFYDCVKEINQKTKDKKKKIQLRYFKEIQREIEDYFYVAEEIVRGKKTLEPGKTAMKSIVNGCENPSDIIEKKVTFFKNLETMGISEDIFNDYYHEKYHKYNIEDGITQSELSNKEDIAIKFLNYIHILRGKQGTLKNYFENIGYIFLSGTFTTLDLAWKLPKEEENKKTVPLATTLEFLTSRFWFKLNKGFSNSNNPLTFDLITKAKCILSSENYKAIDKNHEQLSKDFEAGKITNNQAKSQIVELRKRELNPEAIKEDNCSDILTEDEIIEYKDNLEMANRDKEVLKQESSKKDQEYRKLKKQLLDSKIENMKQLEEDEVVLIKKVNKQIIFFRIKIIIKIIVFFGLGIYFNNSLNPYGWLIGLLLPLVVYLYVGITGKEFNLKKIMDNKNQKIKKNIFGDFCSRKDSLQKEIDDLSINKHN